MKKQKSTTVSLKFNLTKIANLHHVKGGADDLSEESNCCTEFPYCQHTVTTRPDSLKYANNADG